KGPRVFSHISAQHRLAGLPSAQGCFEPSTGAYASLYSAMNSGPQKRTICARDGSRMLTALRRLCGQVSGGPSRVDDQSQARILAPISPPPDRKFSNSGAFGWFACFTLVLSRNADETPTICSARARSYVAGGPV